MRDLKDVNNLLRDESTSLSKAIAILQQQHPLSTPPSISDMKFVRQITQLVSHRAAALLATVIHALWSLRASAKGISLSSIGHVTIGCNGTVIERYPGFRTLSQRYIDALTTFSGASPNAVALEMAVESALFGAAVAVSCLEDH
jgi:hexokinase